MPNNVNTYLRSPAKAKLQCGSTNARKLCCERDEGDKDTEIGERVGVGVATVERVRQKCVQRGLDQALAQGRRPGRKRKLNGKAEAFLVATACSDAPGGRSDWTMQVLAERLVELKVVESISDETVRRTLKKTRSSPGAGSIGASPL